MKLTVYHCSEGYFIAPLSEPGKTTGDLVATRVSPFYRTAARAEGALVEKQAEYDEAGA